MTEAIMYQQQYNPTIHIQEEDTFDYFYPQKLSFTQLIKKKSTHIGRKMSLFKKPDLKLSIPLNNGSQLSRSSSDSSADTFEDNSNDLENAVIYGAPLLDYSGKGHSNFYIKLPNGNWMVRIRDANRKIIGTFEIDGSMV